MADVSNGNNCLGVTSTGGVSSNVGFHYVVSFTLEVDGYYTFDAPVDMNYGAFLLVDGMAMSSASPL
jgi:hypothetical protein